MGGRSRRNSVSSDATESGQNKRGMKWGAAGSSGTELIVVLEEGARVEIVRVEVPGVPFLRLTVLGEKPHERPGGVP